MERSAHDLVQATLLGDAAEDAPVAIFVADDERRYVAVNRFACELLGYERDELLQMTVDDISPFPVSAAQWNEMTTQGRLHGTARVVRKDGSEVEIDFEAGPTHVANMSVYVSFCRPTAAPSG